MAKAPFSPTYMAILDLLFRCGRMARKSEVFSNDFNPETGKYERQGTGKKSARLPEPIVITNTELFAASTPAEWYIIGRIMTDLKEYNALWHLPAEIKRSGNNRIAIKSLIARGILIKTETTDIFLVNPRHIRRGDMFAVLNTTAHMLKDTSCVSIADIRTKKPVHTADFSFEQLALPHL